MLRSTDICACLVTRGDVDMRPIIATIPNEYEIVIWDNSVRQNFYAAGRYLAILETERPVIYFQDDDCLVTCHEQLREEYEPGKIVANMPAHRTDYTDTVLIGWGSLFDRDLPRLAFNRYREHYSHTGEPFWRVGADFVFPMLTPWKRVDLGFEHLPHAHAENRTWRSPGYEKIKATFLDQARYVRDIERFDLEFVPGCDTEGL